MKIIFPEIVQDENYVFKSGDFVVIEWKGGIESKELYLCDTNRRFVCLQTGTYFSGPRTLKDLKTIYPKSVVYLVDPEITLTKIK